MMGRPPNHKSETPFDVRYAPDSGAKADIPGRSPGQCKRARASLGTRFQKALN
jgi:hypothetical protein